MKIRPTYKKPWRKILYEIQDYPDNYTDKKMFLRDLRKNIELKEVSLWEAMLGANLLLQEFYSVIAFVLTYYYLVNNWVKSSLLLKVSCGLTISGFVTYLCFFSPGIKEKLGNDLRTVLTFIVFGQLCSPVLYTLTDTIATDTIYTMTFFMMLVHLVFFDYGVSAAIVSKSLSISAAVFASICLASRLSSADEAFILMTISTETFVLFPILRKEIHNSIVISLVLLFCDCYFLYGVSKILFVLFLLAVFLIGVVCPMLFVKYQKYKDNIYGPWDEAVVDDADSIMFS